MKIVINKCFGGFSLSKAAVKRLAELNGKTAYFFRQIGIAGPYIPATEADEGRFFTAFDVPNPNDFFDTEVMWNNHYLTNRPEDRSDSKLIQVVEELGKEADGDYASLRIVNIPDSVSYEIENYDGIESVHEVHTVWG